MFTYIFGNILPCSSFVYFFIVKHKFHYHTLDSDYQFALAHIPKLSSCVSLDNLLELNEHIYWIAYKDIIRSQKHKIHALGQKCMQMKGSLSDPWIIEVWRKITNSEKDEVNTTDIDIVSNEN